MKKNQWLRKLILFIFIFYQFSFLFLRSARPVDSAALSFTSASATLSNSRLSYRAGLTGSPPSSGATLITINTSGSEADEDTDNLFANDTVCFVDSGQNGCKGNRNYTVQSVIDQTDGSQFTINPALTTDLASSDDAVATQSGTITVRVTTKTDIPLNGTLVVTIPAKNETGKTNDGIPDTNTSIATNGFDLNGIGTSNFSITGCGDSWSEAAPSVGNASNDHTITFTKTSTKCNSGSALVITIGDGSKGVVNPAPITDSTTQGQADIYTIDVTSYTGATALDTVDIDIAPIEGVFVSATVDETLTFTIAGVASSATNCGTNATTDVTTTFNEIPFGEVSDASDFVDAEQQLTVSTNADNGYKVYVEENDELGINGGTSPNIADTPCDSGPCTHTSAQEWVTTTTYGFGYSLQNSSGTDAKFEWDDNTPVTGYKAKQFPNNTESSTQYIDSNAEVMYNAGPVSGSSVYVCYRLNISAVQEPGLYFNKVRYTATATF